MYLIENPVLQRELLANLRAPRSFLMLLVYQSILAIVVFFAWPAETRLEANANAAKQLVDIFFLGQYLIAALMAPSFAAGSITGEKERRTYEMLLASPIRPNAIVMGKLVASLTHLGILVFCSLPIVMLCTPLGGVSLYEVLAAYWGLAMSVLLFGSISVVCSSYFQRTLSSLIASYFLILPLAITAIILWGQLASLGRVRLFAVSFVLPAIVVPSSILLLRIAAQRLLYPPDVGSEGKDVVDIELESEQVLGLVIQRDQFPDRLFAPPQRTDLLPDSANPVYVKEVHSEILSQGTLMLRLVIQISMGLATLLMAVCLFSAPALAPWYIAYVLLFNLLVGPVFSAGMISGERERQTLDLLLTTTIAPSQILFGKLFAGMRISTVLTMFLVWPLLLACVLFWSMTPFNGDSFYWTNRLAIASYFAIILTTCLVTSVMPLVCSLLFRKTTTSLMASYIVLLVLFGLPVAINLFVWLFYPGEVNQAWSALCGLTSPFVAVFATPLTVSAFDNVFTDAIDHDTVTSGSWDLVLAYLFTSLTIAVVTLFVMVRLFYARWRFAQ